MLETNERAARRRFIPGLRLAELFYRDQVQPILHRRHPVLRHSAALIGPGSEVLGFDDEMSTDHHWGPRVMLFLEERDLDRAGSEIRKLLARELPTTCSGFPTSFTPPDPRDAGVQQLEERDTGPVNHRVEILSLRGFFLDYLGLDAGGRLDAVDWLTLPQQKLRSIVAGGVFHDDLGLQEIRARLSSYPHDVWLYVLAAGWTRIGQEEHLMGRAGFAGDELGSAIVGARLARDVMRLGFLMEREYAPYPKWLGTAFGRLRCAERLSPSLAAVVHATSWEQREAGLCAALEALARLHNELGITDELPVDVSAFPWHLTRNGTDGRPFRVIGGERFAEALLERITDPEVRAVAGRSRIGGIDLFADSTDLLEDPALRGSVRRLLEG